MQPTEPADLLREHQEEIQRRRAVADAEQVQDTFQNASDMCSLPVRNPEQSFVVFTLSSEKFAPRTRQGEAPAVRVYGAFASRDEARTYAADLSSFDTGISLLVDETHKWILAPRNETRLNDASIVEKKLRRHGCMLEEEHNEFRARQGRSVGASELEPKEASGDSEGAAVKSDSKGSRHAVPALYQLADQRLAVVSFVCDDSNEFLFKVYGLVDSQADANVWVRNVLSKQIKDHHIDVVATCQWCYPTTMKAERVDAEAFRNKELDTIMNHHKREPSRVKEFSDWYKASEAAPSNSVSIQEIEGETTECAHDDGRHDGDGDGSTSGA